ncbi:TolB family protein [candidate division KSB1 bacterium]
MLKRMLIISLVLVPALSCSQDKDSNLIEFDESTVWTILEEPQAGDPCWSLDMTTIVYTASSDLWAVSPEGDEPPTQVTSMSGRELYPNWSPLQGSSNLVFVNSAGSEENTIYTLNYVAGEPVAVQTFTGLVASTSFSRDGAAIVFLQPGKKGIFTIPVEGGEVTQIPNDAGWGAVEVAQASPARDAVIFIDKADGAFRINSINFDGTDLTTVISFSGGREHPTAVAESYDGAKIAYTSPGLRPGSNLFFISPDGGLPTALTWFPYMQLDNPTWAWDGSRVVTQMDEGLYMVEPKN